MTIRELDRLVSQTDITPVSKKTLRHVREAVMSGRASDPSMGRYDWSVGVVSKAGTPIRFRFTLRKATYGRDQA